MTEAIPLSLQSPAPLPAKSLPARIPVFLLGGFLGAGKSTLLNAFLNDPAVKDTAVIINEFGDVPVDHLLVRQGETTIQQVSTGCLCCSDTTDLHQTLSDLQSAYLDGRTGAFSRVIVEMSGLGDPAPLVNALTGPFVASKGAPGSTDEAAFYLAGVVTLFDAVAGTDTVETHFEALKQLAFADRIVLTKTDLSGSDEPEAGDTSLRANLRSLNAGADILDRRMVDLADLFAPRPYSTLERGEDVEGWLALEAVLAQEAGHNAPGETDGRDARHGKGIRTFSLTSDKPVSRHRLQCFLHLLQSSAGRRLLRVKGIVALEETPDEPLIVHAVQHVVSPPLRLSAWPDADRRTRLVFITEGIDPDPVKDLFRAVFDAAPFSFAKILKSTGRAVFAAIARPFSQFTNSSRRSQ